MRRWVPFAGGVLGLGIIVYALFSSETDEERIVDKLGELAEAASKTEESSNPVFRVARLNEAFEDIFTRNVVYSIPELTSRQEGRAALGRLAAESGAAFTTLDIGFEDVRVDVGGSGTVATVRSVATVHGQRGGEVDRDQRRVTFEFVSEDGDWRIASFRVYPKEDE